MKVAQLIVTAVFAFCGGVTFQALNTSVTAQKADKPGPITASKIEVVNDDGKVVGTWGASGIKLIDAYEPTGNDVKDAMIRGLTDRPTLKVMDRDGEAYYGYNARLYAFKSDALETQRITIYDDEWNDVTGLWKAAGLHDTNGFLAGSADGSGAILTFQKEAGGALNLNDKNGTRRMSLGWNTRGKPAIFFYDGDDNLVDMVGGK